MADIFTIVYVNIGSENKSTFSNSILSIPQYVLSMYLIYIYIPMESNTLNF